MLSRLKQVKFRMVKTGGYGVDDEFDEQEELLLYSDSLSPQVTTFEVASCIFDAEVLEKVAACFRGIAEELNQHVPLSLYARLLSTSCTLETREAYTELVGNSIRVFSLTFCDSQS
jgi:hypothetical protein